MKRTSLLQRITSSADERRRDMEEHVLWYMVTEIFRLAAGMALILAITDAGSFQVLDTNPVSRLRFIVGFSVVVAFMNLLIKGPYVRKLLAARDR